MASHFTGPIRQRKQSKEAPRALFGDVPIAIDPEFDIVMEDFRETLDTNVWTTVKDSGASAATGTDASHGELVLTSAATTDDDGASLQEANETWDLVSGKKLVFEARVKMSEATQSDFWCGLSVAFATNPEAALTAADRVGFQKDDGDASILCKTEKGGTETSTDSGEDAADATYVKLGFRYDGDGNVDFYVDRKWVARHTANLPDDETLKAGIMTLSGVDTGTNSATCDYILIAKER